MNKPFSGDSRNYGLLYALFSLMTFTLFPDSGIIAEEKPRKAENIVEAVEKAIETIDTLSCEFSRTVYRKESDVTRAITGTLYLKKPHFFRIEYSGRTIVVDGETVRTYIPRNKQVQIDNYLGDKDYFPSPHLVFKHYAEEREAIAKRVEELAGKTCEVLIMVPKDPNDSAVTVWVDRATNIPVRAREIEPGGDVIVHELSNVVINPDLKPDIFELDLPNDVMTVDLR